MAMIRGFIAGRASAGGRVGQCASPCLPDPTVQRDRSVTCALMRARPSRRSLLLALGAARRSIVASVRARPVVRRSRRGDAGRGADASPTSTRVRVHEREIDDPDRRAARCARALYEPRGAAPHGAAVVRAASRRASTNRGSSAWRGNSRPAASTVVTPDIPELSRFEITPAITDAIERAGGVAGRSESGARAATAGRHDGHQLQRRAVDRRGRPALARRTASPTCSSFGGHDDLPRVLRYLCTGSSRGRQARSGSSSAHSGGPRRRSCGRRTTTASP